MNRLTCFEVFNNSGRLGQELTNDVACIRCLGRVSAQQWIADISTLKKEYV